MLLLLLLAGLSLIACGDEAPPTATEEPAVEGEAIFHDVTAESGLDFAHFNGMFGELYITETTGAGLGLLDYDGDGDLDLYVVQGAAQTADGDLERTDPQQRGPLPPGDRLYRNDPVIGDGGSVGVRFVDVTDASGITAYGYGMGIAVADYDQDGWSDLYVANWGRNQLWRNRGDGTFEDVTETSGTGDPDWGTSTAFLDYDLDGLPDLFVANYVQFTEERHKICHTRAGTPDYCHPSVYDPETDRLFRNQGDGTFADVSRRAGLASEAAAGLGVMILDHNGDGLTDIYVTNDEYANHLWANQGDGTFSNEAFYSGVALNREGMAEASMGVDAGDFDNDGDEDLIMAHLTHETHTLYVNVGNGLYEDRTFDADLGTSTWEYTGFGIGWIDYDNDGLLDLLGVNGLVHFPESGDDTGDPYPLGQTNQLFRNLGGGGFEETTARAGEAFQQLEIGRGAAFGDIDGDGDLDVAISNNNGPARVLLNTTGQTASWCTVRTAAGLGWSPSLEASAVLRTGNGATYSRRSRGAASFMAANDPRIHFGLGAAPVPVELRVRHSDGREALFIDAPADRHLVLPHLRETV